MKKNKKRIIQRRLYRVFFIAFAIIASAILPTTVFAQNLVKGTVTDEKGSAVNAASVTIKGTKKGTVTDASGTFTLNAKEGDVLVVSSVGFSVKEVKVGKGDVQIVLQEKATDLTDVVVVGYGKQSKKNLVSSITSIKQEDINKGAVRDVGQMLQGKVAGLNVTKSGEPTANATVILRGPSTLNGSSSPFYVIDGVSGADITLVAPDDIVTIDILKDAAATAIYGNRAANGVIMITTKRGKAGQAVLSYSGYIAMEQVSNRLEMMSGDQLRDFCKKNNLNLAPEDDKGANTNWQDVVQRTGMSHNHNISLSGGNEKTVYSASINYFDQQGIIKYNKFNRIIARMSLEQKAFNDKLKLGLNMSKSFDNNDWVPNRNAVLTNMLFYLPVSPVKNQDGTYFENLGASGRTNYFNPLGLLESGVSNYKVQNFTGTATAQLKLPFGFTYDASFTYRSGDGLYGGYNNKYFTDHYNGIRVVQDPGGGAWINDDKSVNGMATRDFYRNTTVLFENYLTWDKKLGGHSINAVTGYSYQKTQNGDGLQASSTNFPTDNMTYYNLSLGDPYSLSNYRIGLGWDRYDLVKMISNFARVNYNYEGKYMFQVSVRRDGSNVFGDNKKWGWFPAAGIAWRISQEKFMESQQVVSDLKLRVGYGKTGNAAGFGSYTPLLRYGKMGEMFDAARNVITSGMGPIANPNPDLGWENTFTSNIGLDFAFLKGRISGSVDVYKKVTKDMIFDYIVPPQQYYTGLITANGGEMSNKGIEVVLNAIPVKNNIFTWETSLNFSHNKNLVVSLKNPSFKVRDSIPWTSMQGAGQSGNTVQILQQGAPVGQFLLFKYAGKNPSGLSVFYKQNGDTTSGDIKAGLKGDYHYASDPQPKLLFGWNNTFNYKGFDLNIFVRGVLGAKVLNATRADLFKPFQATISNLPVEAANESVLDFKDNYYSDRFIEDASYLRFDNATLGYNFEKVCKYIQKIRAYASTNNLFVITRYKGIDPEINMGGLAPGVDYGNFYPKTRTFLLGVNVTF